MLGARRSNAPRNVTRLLSLARMHAARGTLGGGFMCVGVSTYYALRAEARGAQTLGTPTQTAPL
jgi:hypothetical protein